MTNGYGNNRALREYRSSAEAVSGNKWATRDTVGREKPLAFERIKNAVSPTAFVRPTGIEPVAHGLEVLVLLGYCLPSVGHDKSVKLYY